VSQVADCGCTGASNEPQEEERTVRFDDLAAAERCGNGVVLVLDTAVFVAFHRLAPTGQDVAGSRSVQVRIGTVGAGDLDCVSLFGLSAVVPLTMMVLPWTNDATCK
jgi:hypothetical protein